LSPLAIGFGHHDSIERVKISAISSSILILERLTTGA